MPNIRAIDMLFLDDLLGMGGRYVLNFSDLLPVFRGAAMRAYRGMMSPSIYSSQQLRTSGPQISRQLLPKPTGEDNTFYPNADYLFSSLFVRISYQGPIDGDARLCFVNLTNAKF
jgi:hypothetical protein